MTTESGTYWFVLEMGCAECGDMPLALPRGVFPSEAEAREAASEHMEGWGRWIDHPNGGVFCQWGSGGLWVGPASSLWATNGEFGCEYDEQYR